MISQEIEQVKNKIIDADIILRKNSSPFRVSDVVWWESDKSGLFTTEVLSINLNGEPLDPYETLATEKTERTSESFEDSANTAIKDAACKISSLIRSTRLVSTETKPIRVDRNDMFEVTARFGLEDKELISTGINKSFESATIIALVKGYQAPCAINA